MDIKQLMCITHSEKECAYFECHSIEIKDLECRQ